MPQVPDAELARLRLAAQRITADLAASPTEAVRWMGALQGQDYAASLWAVGLRTTQPSLAGVEGAIERRELIRTWPMRGTLHLVAPENVRWMLELCTPRIIARTAGRDRQLELDDSLFLASAKVLEAALTQTGSLTRAAIYATLEAAGIPAAGQRGIHIIGRLAQRGLICFGPRVGKQPAFVLLDRWIAPVPEIAREEALVLLADIYFRSHGPATVHDFAWWSNLTLGEAREGLEGVRGSLVSHEVGGREYWLSPSTTAAEPDDTVYLLPGFDEFILGYQDRSAILAPDQARRITPGNNGMFLAAAVSNGGEVLGTWRKTVGKRAVTVGFEPFDGVTDLQRPAAASLARYSRFHGFA